MEPTCNAKHDITQTDKALTRHRKEDEMNADNTKKNQAVEPSKLIEDTIGAFGIESMEVADLFLRLEGLPFGKTGKNDPDKRMLLVTDRGHALDGPTVLDWYIYDDSALTGAHLGQIESAFAFALPKWAATEPRAVDDAVAILVNVGVYYANAGGLDKWEPFIKRILQICKTGLGQNHKAVVTVLYEMGVRYLAWDKFDEAGDCFKEALSICDSDSDLRLAHGPGLLMNYSGVAFRKDQLGVARCLLDQAMEILEEQPTVAKDALFNTLCNYAALFEATHNLKEFDRVSQQAEEVAKEVWKSQPTSVSPGFLSLIRLNLKFDRLKDALRQMRWFNEKMEEVAADDSDVYGHLMFHFWPIASMEIPSLLDELESQLKANALSSHSL